MTSFQSVDVSAELNCVVASSVNLSVNLVYAYSKKGSLAVFETRCVLRWKLIWVSSANLQKPSVNILTIMPFLSLWRASDQNCVFIILHYQTVESAPFVNHLYDHIFVTCRLRFIPDIVHVHLWACELVLLFAPFEECIIKTETIFVPKVDYSHWARPQSTSIRQLPFTESVRLETVHRVSHRETTNIVINDFQEFRSFLRAGKLNVARLQIKSIDWQQSPYKELFLKRSWPCTY